MIWRFTYIYYKAKEQQWKESKNETKREQQTKNTWANNYIVRRISKIRIERKNEERNDTFVHVTKWCIQEKYDNKSIRRLWKLREENKSKQQHTQMKRKSRWLATIHDQLYMINYTWSTIHDQLYMINYAWWAHGSSGCILVTLCQATKSTYSHLIIYKINICARNHNEVRCSKDHSTKHTCFSKQNTVETVCVQHTCTLQFCCTRCRF